MIQASFGFYVATVGALTALTFLAPLLHQAGLTEAQTSATLISLPIGALFVGPVSANIVDRYGYQKMILLGALLGSALLFLALPFLPPPLIVGGVVLLAMLRAPVFPLADASTYAAFGSRYGRIRGVGSISYVLGMLLMAGLRDPWPASPFLYGSLLLFGAGLCVPLLPPPPAPVPGGRIRDLLVSRSLAILFAIAFLNGLSITLYDNLFTLLMDSREVRSEITAGAIAWGVLVEVGVFGITDPLLRRFHPSSLLLTSVAVGAPRFFLTGWLENPLLIAGVQGLHGVQFGLFWISGMALVQQHSPSHLRSTAQALFAAASFGIAPIVGLSLSSIWLTSGDLSSLFSLLTVPCLVATALATAYRRR